MNEAEIKFLLLFFCFIQCLLSAGYAELVEKLVYAADAQTGFVGTEVAGGHAGQEDFLVVSTGENFGFFG
jgi:hypothetical protein